jgi:hypothetical protein
MKKTGIIRLYPTTGKIVPNCFVDHSGQLLNVDIVYPNDTLLLSNGLLIGKYNCRLLKYYVVCKHLHAELHYEDYNKVKVNDKILADINPIDSPAIIGDTVQVNKFKLLECFYNNPISGVIMRSDNRVFTVELNDGKLVELKRHMFNLTNRSNTKYIARLIANNTNEDGIKLEEEHYYKTE